MGGLLGGFGGDQGSKQDLGVGVGVMGGQAWSTGGIRGSVGKWSPQRDLGRQMVYEGGLEGQAVSAGELGGSQSQGCSQSWGACRVHGDF